MNTHRRYLNVSGSLLQKAHHTVMVILPAQSVVGIDASMDQMKEVGPQGSLETCM